MMSQPSSTFGLESLNQPRQFRQISWTIFLLFYFQTSVFWTLVSMWYSNENGHSCGLQPQVNVDFSNIVYYPWEHWRSSLLKIEKIIFSTQFWTLNLKTYILSRIIEQKRAKPLGWLTTRLILLDSLRNKKKHFLLKKISFNWDSLDIVSSRDNVRIHLEIHFF